MLNPRTRRDTAAGASASSAACAATSRRAVALDYMPALRLMSKSEQLREIAKTKRRFVTN